MIVIKLFLLVESLEKICILTVLLIKSINIEQSKKPNMIKQTAFNQYFVNMTYKKNDFIISGLGLKKHKLFIQYFIDRQNIFHNLFNVFIIRFVKKFGYNIIIQAF